MNKIASKSLFIAFVVLAQGCSILAKNYIPDPLITHQYDASLANYITKDETIDLSKVDLISLDGEDKTKERARFIASLVTMSDKKCELHKATMMSNSNNWNISTGVATILFSGYAAVATSVEVAKNAAALAAATTGIQGQVNQEVYQGKLVTAVVRAIEVARAKSYATLAEGMNNNNYTSSQMVLDISRYHSSCSLMSGVTELTKAIENRPKSRNEIDRDIARLKREIADTTSNNSTSIVEFKTLLGKNVLMLMDAKE
jgi:hypothetical protein